MMRRRRTGRGCLAEDPNGAAMDAATRSGKVDGNVPHPVVSRKLWLSKIKAGLEATAGTDCVLIARTEAKLELGLDEAIERCVLAAELGAEMTYVHALRTLDECRKVAEALPGWKMFGDVATLDGVASHDIVPLPDRSFRAADTATSRAFLASSGASALAAETGDWPGTRIAASVNGIDLSRPSSTLLLSRMSNRTLKPHPHVGALPPSALQQNFLRGFQPPKLKAARKL